MRQELQDLILRDLLGPAGGQEEVVEEQYVRDRYILGLLAPKGQSALPDDDEDLALAEKDTEDGTAEPASLRSSTLLPSSIGLTFTATGSAIEIQITARWGRYERLSSQELGQESDKPKMLWKRYPVEHTSQPVPLKVGRMKRWIPDPNFPDVYVDGLYRLRNDQWVITLFLVNGQAEPTRLKDTAWVFQPELVVSAPDHEPIFRKRQLLRDVYRTDSGRPEHGDALPPAGRICCWTRRSGPRRAGRRIL